MMFSCLSCQQDLTISVPCAHLPHAKCSKGVFLAYMVPRLAIVVSIPACLCLLSLTYTASAPNLGLWMPLNDEYSGTLKVQGTVYGHSCESFTQQIPAWGPVVAGTLTSWYLFYCAS